MLQIAFAAGSLSQWVVGSNIRTTIRTVLIGSFQWGIEGRTRLPRAAWWTTRTRLSMSGWPGDAARLWRYNDCSGAPSWSSLRWFVQQTFGRHSGWFSLVTLSSTLWLSFLKTELSFFCLRYSSAFQMHLHDYRIAIKCTCLKCLKSRVALMALVT